MDPSIADDSTAHQLERELLNEGEWEEYTRALKYFGDLRRHPSVPAAIGARRTAFGAAMTDAQSLVYLARETVLGIARIGQPRPVSESVAFREYARAVIALVEPVRVLTAALEVARTTQDAMGETATSLISSTAESVEARFEDALNALRQVVELFPADEGAPEARIITELSYERLRHRKLLDETRVARDAAVSASDSARIAAGTTASSTLAEHFGTHAKKEAMVANVLRIIASILLLLISGFAGYVLTASQVTTESFGDEVARLATTIPVAVLAGYLGRESSRHRTSANWSRQLEIQLKTLDAFIAPLSTDEQQRQRAELGRRVFGVQESASNPENAPALIPETASLLESVANLLRGPQTK